MATELIFQTFTGVAAADLSAKQFYAVSLDTSGTLNLATAAKNIDGILQNKPTTGQAATVARDGFTKAAISASSNVAIGDLLEVDTLGTLKKLASGTAVAKALEAVNVAAVTIISVELLRNNAAFV